MPLIVLLFGNITILICWTLIDPLVYKRFEIDGASWSSYGRCVGSSNVSNLFLSLLGVLNAVVLFLALFQAWKARNISDEFSETKIVGSAVSHRSRVCSSFFSCLAQKLTNDFPWPQLYGWLQLLIVGVPVLFLISDDNTTARYFVLAALIFLVSMSMLLIIFVPLFIQIRRALAQQKVQVESSLMDPQLSRTQLQQFGSRVRSSSLPTFNTVSKTLSPHRDTQQGIGGKGQECQESSSSVVVAAAMPV